MVRRAAGADEDEDVVDVWEALNKDALIGLRAIAKRYGIKRVELLRRVSAQLDDGDPDTFDLVRHRYGGGRRLFDSVDFLHVLDPLALPVARFVNNATRDNNRLVTSPSTFDQETVDFGDADTDARSPTSVYSDRGSRASRGSRKYQRLDSGSSASESKGDDDDDDSIRSLRPKYGTSGSNWEVICNKNPTLLVKLLKKQSWSKARTSLKVNPIEARTWVLGTIQMKRDHIHYARHLPLHVACVLRAPVDVIEALIEANPEGPKSRDDDGMIPLHIAANVCGNVHAVGALLIAFPEGCHVRDARGQLPIDKANMSDGPHRAHVLTLLRRYKTLLKLVTPEEKDKTTGCSVIEECDFDRGGTLLFRCAFAKNWIGTLARTFAAPNEAGIWVYRRRVLVSSDEFRGGRTRFRALPLHIACTYGAPAPVIGYLITVDPEGPTHRDDKGNLPLHLACTGGCSGWAVRCLVRAFPSACEKKDSMGRTALDIAKSTESPFKEDVVSTLTAFVKTKSTTWDRCTRLQRVGTFDGDVKGSSPKRSKSHKKEEVLELARDRSINLSPNSTSVETAMMEPWELAVEEEQDPVPERDVEKEPESEVEQQPQVEQEPQSEQIIEDAKLNDEETDKTENRDDDDAVDILSRRSEPPKPSSSDGVSAGAGGGAAAAAEEEPAKSFDEDSYRNHVVAPEDEDDDDMFEDMRGQPRASKNRLQSIVSTLRHTSRKKV